MDFIKSELDKEFKTIGLRNQRRSVYARKHQVGKTNIPRDQARKALAPGKKISKTGKTYYEYRKNRVDIVGSKV